MDKRSSYDFWLAMPIFSFDILNQFSVGDVFSVCKFPNCICVDSVETVYTGYFIVTIVYPKDLLNLFLDSSAPYTKELTTVLHPLASFLSNYIHSPISCKSVYQGKLARAIKV